MTNDLPRLPLIYAFHPPATIQRTSDPNHPVVNSLILSIINPTDQPIEAGSGDADVPKEGDLPSIDVPASGLDRIYVYFRWGDDPSSLCTAEQAANIMVASLSSSWFASAQQAPQVGVYWILFPQTQVVLEPYQQVQFRFDNIVSTSPDGFAPLYVKAVINGYQADLITPAMVFKQG